MLNDPSEVFVVLKHLHLTLLLLHGLLYRLVGVFSMLALAFFALRSALFELSLNRPVSEMSLWLVCSDGLLAERLTDVLIDAMRSARFNRHLGCRGYQHVLCAKKSMLSSGHEHGIRALLHHHLPILSQIGLVGRLAHFDQCGD